MTAELPPSACNTRKSYFNDKKYISLLLFALPNPLGYIRLQPLQGLRYAKRERRLNREHGLLAYVARDCLDAGDASELT